MATSENPAAMHERRANWNAPFPQSLFGFLDGGKQKRVHASTVLHGTRLAKGLPGRFVVMLHMALVFLVIGLISALLGFTTIAGASFGIAKFLAGLFLILFLVFLIIGLSAVGKIVD